MVLHFQCVVRCGNSFALCHVCGSDVGRLLSLFGSSAQARMCGDCFVVGCFVVGIFSWSIYWCNVSCMACVCVVVSLWSLRCSWFAGKVSVAFRVDNAM